MRWPKVVIGLAAAVVALVGCGPLTTTTTTTTISANGSFKQHIVYEVPRERQSRGASQVAFTKRVLLFQTPNAASGARVRQTSGRDEDRIVVDRSVPANAAPVNDITLLADDRSPLVSSALTVRRLAGNRLEYDETVRWVGRAGRLTSHDDPHLRARINRALPRRLKTATNVDHATQRVLFEMLRAMCGPPKPFSLFDTKEEVLKAAIYTRFVSGLSEAVPEATMKERAAVANDLLKPDAFFQKSNEKDPPIAKKLKDASGSTVLSFEVKAPGKVIGTNGLIDKSSGIVRWKMAAFAAAVGDVKLRLVVQL